MVVASFVSIAGKAITIIARGAIKVLIAQTAIVSTGPESGLSVMDLNDVYAERNQLVAHLASRYDSAIGIDPNEPDWPVIYIELPTGQVSWHINRDELPVFDGVPWNHNREVEIKWDGHTTEEKYGRLNAHTRLMHIDGGRIHNGS